MQQGIYDAYELACALRPSLIRLLLEQGEVVFTDTDTCFYAPVDDLAHAASEVGLVLIPQTARPAPARVYFPLTEVEYRDVLNGFYNPGLFAVGSSGRAFLDWWADWLARDCLREPSEGMWTDQQWLDWAPVYFEHLIVRDSSLNVGFWNLDEREIHELHGRPAIDGAPLRHFHFAGFDPRRAGFLSTYREDDIRFIGRGWPPTPSPPVLTRLLQQYAQRLNESGVEELRDRPYDYDLSAGGRRLDRRERSIYREAVLAAEARGTDPPPNPFDPQRIDEFARLVDDPASLRSLSTQARKRLELVRPPGWSPSSVVRVSRRLVAGARYALTEEPPADLAIHERTPSDAVRLEYLGSESP